MLALDASSSVWCCSRIATIVSGNLSRYRSARSIPYRVSATHICTWAYLSPQCPCCPGMQGVAYPRYLS
jgi:hypothetical protein